jgi:2-isopropylmalate synthase
MGRTQRKIKENKTMDKIYIFDTALRDGEQSPGASLNTKEKIEIARQLARLNVDVIEAGFPIASPGDFEAVEMIAGKIDGPIIAGLARCVKKDIEAAKDALKPAKASRIHVFLATSEIHRKHKLQKAKEEIISAAVESVKYAKNFSEDVEFSAEDAARTEPDYLCRVVEEVIKAGANVVNIPDTVGYAIPDKFGSLINILMNKVPNINKAIISVHCHNDLGLATANSLSAVVNGARQIECTINGLGERAGNASLEEIVMILKTRKDMYNYELKINTQEIYKSSHLVSTLTGIYVQPNKAIVGANAFRHEAGIHQDGVLKEKSTYEIMTPEEVGVTTAKLVLGKHSGRHGFKSRLEELGYFLEGDAFEKAFDRFIKLADKKKEIFDKDIEAIIEDEISRVEELYYLESIKYTSGTEIKPEVEVKIKNTETEEIIKETSSGDGPVDSAYKAIDKALNIKDVKLADYSLRAISSGKDALGEVIVKIKKDDKIIRGRGSSTDIIEASVRAYVNALNRMKIKAEK